MHKDLRHAARFHYLRQPDSQWLTGGDLDSLARALQDALPDSLSW